MFRPLLRNRALPKGREESDVGPNIKQIAAAIALVLALPTLTYALAAPAAAEPSDRDIAVYRAKLSAYQKARRRYEALAGPYWDKVTSKRAARRRAGRNHRPVPSDYVLDQPPLYKGPSEPKDPRKKRPPGEPVPVAADFLAQAKAHFGFVPDAPETEDHYRRAYAEAALAAGLTAEECVKVYGFESGGNGGHDVQAGLEYKKPGARAITTALGYNQLLTTNSIEMIAEAGDEMMATLKRKLDRARGERREALARKITILRRMIAFSRTVPDRWSAHQRLAGTDRGLAVHALILDVDIGPLLQARKLLTSVEYARRLGYREPLTAAELEMMNLTGDGNGFDMVMMPPELRKKVPTANFFQKGGYERNPVAIRNNTVALLLAATDAKMASEAMLPGARALQAAFDAAKRGR